MTLKHFTAKLATVLRVQCGSPARHVAFSALPAQSMLNGKKRGVEALWRDMFSNTSQWWDHRPQKINQRFPDFKHKQTGEALWLVDARNPTWVQAELAALQPGTLQPNVFAWAQRLKGYVKAGQYVRTIEVFHQMHQERISPDPQTFLPVLNACAGLGDLEEGKRVHTQIRQRGFESDIYVANCLVDMYAKCGSIADAWSVFNKMPEQDVVSWNVMIGAYVKSGQGLRAIELFRKMQLEGVEPSGVTFVGLLNACASVGDLAEGKHAHKQIIQRGYDLGVQVANCLVDMYAKCGSIKDAWSVFNKMREHTVVSWNAMIGGCVKSGQGLKALKLFQKMQQQGMEPNTVTFVGVLNACAGVAALEEGRLIHRQIIERGYECDVYVATCLADMYAKCGSIEDAWTVFHKMQKHDVVFWNAMIGGCVKSGQGLKAMQLFREMQLEEVQPDAVTFVGVLNACSSLAALEEGRSVHKQVIEKGCMSDVYVANCLIDMYAKCGSIEDACSVFNQMEKRDVVSWSSMIVGYVKCGQGLRALQLFGKMQEEGMDPDAVTFVGVLNACASATALQDGRCVHEQIIQKGWELDIYVANCLIDMYAKCGSIGDAWSVFNRMCKHDVASWNVMIGSYVKSGQGLKAMELFREMQLEEVEPDNVTFVGLLNACASVAALEEGRRVHEQIIARGYESDIYVATCLVDMYAKCGSIEDAWSVFTNMPEHDVVPWNAMLGGYAMHGHAKAAIELFKRMSKGGVEIDDVTFTCLLSACSHGGLVTEGLRYFKSMTSAYNLLPTAEQYACMVDLLGRAGWLEEAEELTKKMPTDRDPSLWMSLLGACRIYGDIEIAERAAKQCWELDPVNDSGYVLLSNIYAAAGKWDRSATIEKLRLERKVWKEPDRTWIEVNNGVHSFLENEMQHPQILKIRGSLEILSVQMNEAGYVPETRFLFMKT